ncbi:MAG: leucine-rich repeat domain-containing protein, partial [Pirellula sp.]
MKRNQPMFFTVVRSGVMAAGLAMACGTHSGLSHAQESAGVTSKSAASQSAVGQAIAAIKSMPGIAVQEKDGEVIGVDFRKCGDDWIKTFPRVLEIPSVQTVSVSGPAATHELIVSLKSMPNLKALRMEQASITDDTIAQIAKFPKVDDLLLDRCGITDASMQSLGQSKTIKRIRAPRTKLSDAGLAYLKDTVQLELLDLSDCNQISDAGLAHLQGLSKLRNLSLWGPRITDEG